MLVIPDARPRTAAPASQLLLVINRTVYRVKPIRCDPSAAVRAFRLNKPDGTLYDVAQTRFGAQCDCPDFVYRRDGLDPHGCKHVKSLVAEGLIEAAPARAAGRARTGPGGEVDRAVTES